MYRRFPIQDPRRLVDGAMLLASYVLLICVCAGAAILAFAGASRVGVIIAKTSSVEHWDGPNASAAPRTRSAVLNDGITFRYLSSRQQPITPAKPPLKGVRSGLLKSAPEQEITPWGFWNWGQPQPVEPVQPVLAATYRTVCVRLCDGAFFPISFSTPADRFSRDEKLCQSQCGSPAKLYVYKNPGGELEQMRDVNGEPYTKLETAFKYKTSYDAQCTCKAQPWETAAIEKHKQYAALESAAKTDKKAAAELNKLKASPVKMGRKSVGKVVLTAQPEGTVSAYYQLGNGQKIAVISAVGPNSNGLLPATKPVKPKAQPNNLIFKPAFVPTADKPKAGKKSKSRQARVYNGSDWRINGFQTN